METHLLSLPLIIDETHLSLSLITDETHLLFSEGCGNLLPPQHHELLSEGIPKSVGIQREKPGSRLQIRLVSDLGTCGGHEVNVAKVKDAC